MISAPTALKRIVRPILPRKVRPRTILRGPLRGHPIVASWHDYPAALLGYTEGPLIRWLRSTVRRGETWLDVGAHYGYTALALAQLVGISGRVFAFEPVQNTAGCLCETRALNGLEHLQVVPVGLSDSDQMTTIDVSFVRGMAQPELQRGCGRHTICVTSLDHIWTDLARGNERADGVKLDVQGMELNALTGMRAFLEAWQPRLAIEFHPGVDRDAVLELLEACGYGVGTPIAPLPGEEEPIYADDRTYVFLASGPRRTC